MEEWKPCIKRPVVVHVREVIGEQEEIRTLENKRGETLIAKCDEDYVIMGTSGELYPIKKGVFHETYEYVDEAEASVATGVCRRTGRQAAMQITLTHTFLASRLDMPQRIEDYIYNPQPGQTMLNVLKDLSDSRGVWSVTNIKCEVCGESMSQQAALSHFGE